MNNFEALDVVQYDTGTRYVVSPVQDSTTKLQVSGTLKGDRLMGAARNIDPSRCVLVGKAGRTGAGGWTCQEVAQ